MKIIKSLLCAIVAATAFAFCTASANASIGIVTNFDVLTLTLTVRTNPPPIIRVSTKVFQINTVRLATKDILNLLQTAQFADTKFPSGSRLVLGWDEPWNGHVLVVDSTSTNVLFDAGATNLNYVTVNFFAEPGAFSGTSGLANPGSQSFTLFNNAMFALYDSTTGDTNILTYLSGAGPCRQTYRLSWDKNGNPTTWSDNQNFSGVNGGRQVLNGVPYGTISGTITGRGSGSGAPFFFTQGSGI